MPKTHYQETDTIRVALCSMGLIAQRNFVMSRIHEEVTCRTCIHKLMKWTGRTDLYQQGYPGPYIGV